ncbi:MAG: histidinol-phosphate transaminase [Pseudomonadota bacterium]
MAETSNPAPLPQILDISPYVPGHAPDEAAGVRTYKLASNENPLGCSPAARAAYIAAAEKLEVYPSGDAAALREAIGARYGLDPNRIICGAGSDEIFQMLARAYLAPGDNIVQSAHAFLVYKLVAQQSGAETIDAPERELTADVDALLERVTPRTKLVFIANPNNPTGTYLPFDEVRRLHACLPSNVLLVLDGAYAEYVRNNDYSSGVELVSEFDNVIMTRTFSKIHGLAALRLGWAYGPASVIDALHRVRGPFNVSAPAQAAGIAALQDQDFVDRSVAINETGKAALSEGCAKLGLPSVDSVGNFVLVRCPDDPKRNAAAAAAFLKTRHITVRAMAAYKLADYIRISVGDADAVDAVLEGLRAFMATA